MRRSRLALVALVATLVAAACGSGGDGRLKLGVRALALDLTFADEALAEPVEAERIIRIIPAPPDVSEPADLEQFAGSPEEPASVNPCPSASPAAAPRLLASVGQDMPPREGSYGRHNTGTFTVTGGTLDLTLPYPPFTRDDITDIREIEPAEATDLVGRGEQPEQQDSGQFEWSVTHVLTSDFSVTTRYRLTDDAVQVIELISRNAETERSVRPVPPVDLLQLNEGEGHEWSSAGVDSEESTAFQIDGRIERREAVDVCGELVDTYRVITTETLVNLVDGSVTSTNEPNRYNIATQFGGLIVETEQHYTEQSRERDSGTPISITYDFVSTLDSIEPDSGGSA